MARPRPVPRGVRDRPRDPSGRDRWNLLASGRNLGDPDGPEPHGLRRRTPARMPLSTPRPRSAVHTGVPRDAEKLRGVSRQAPESQPEHERVRGAFRQVDQVGMHGAGHPARRVPSAASTPALREGHTVQASCQRRALLGTVSRAEQRSSEALGYSRGALSCRSSPHFEAQLGSTIGNGGAMSTCSPRPRVSTQRLDMRW